jgi:uncharacterized protein (DUF885 family)
MPGGAVRRKASINVLSLATVAGRAYARPSFSGAFAVILDRRQLMLTTAAGLAVASPAFAAVAKKKPAGPNARSAALIDRFANEIIDENPTTATGLGLDKGKRAALKFKLGDRSWASVEREAAECATRLKRMKAVDRKSLTGASSVTYDAVTYANQLGVEAGRFKYGDNSLSSAMSESATPYVVSQQGGAFSQVPEFLNSQHLINAPVDCESYLARMEAFAGVLDQETERVKRDTGQGVIAPTYILDNALGQLAGFRATPPADAPLTQSLAMRAKAKGFAGDWAGKSAALIEDRINPALDRQIAALKAAREKANEDAGVWKLPDGEAYYGWLLKVGTSTPHTADEIHGMGLEQNAQIESRMDALLKKQGLTQGSVGERVQALTKDPRFLYPNTDEGRAKVLAYLNGRIAAARASLPKMSRLKMKAPVIAKRVPPDIQDGAGLGYMNSGSLDGSRPAIYYINLKDTANWPTFTLPSLTYHETLPGHAWQGAYLAEHNAPLINSLMGFNAYVEGWALYAEQLADEMGLYADDPFGKLGYLQAQQFRACRLVADTGLHAKRWTREQTVDFLTTATGRARAAMTSETDRYIGTPGQACGYKVGHTEINRLRDGAKKRLGKRFDVRDFDDAVVEAGSVPLTVLATVIDTYVAKTMAAKAKAAK